MKPFALIALGATFLLILQAQTAPSQPAEAARSSAPPATGFLHKTIELDGQTYAYVVWAPPGYTPDKPWPTILSLHGSGEAGEDGFLQTDVGIARAIRRNHARFPAIVVMPQCRRGDVWWSDAMMKLAIKCVEKTSTEYHVDARRVYLTGLSLGGAGALRIGAVYADNFAAIVPIAAFWSHPQLPAAAPELRKAATALARVPTWFFHGSRDVNVLPDRAREVVNAFREAGGEAKFTEFPDGDHFIWDRVYDDPGVMQWMLAQRAPERAR